MNERDLQQELLDMSFEQSKYAKSERLNVTIKPDDILPEPPTYGWNESPSQIWNEDLTVKVYEKDTLPREGPFQHAVEANTEGVVRQELTTYKKRDGYFIKETNTRVFCDSDYTDSTHTTILYKL